MLKPVKSFYKKIKLKDIPITLISIKFSFISFRRFSILKIVMTIK